MGGSDGASRINQAELTQYMDPKMGLGVQRWCKQDRVQRTHQKEPGYKMSGLGKAWKMGMAEV